MKLALITTVTITVIILAVAKSCYAQGCYSHANVSHSVEYAGTCYTFSSVRASHGEFPSQCSTLDLQPVLYQEITSNGSVVRDVLQEQLRYLESRQEVNEHWISGLHIRVPSIMFRLRSSFCSFILPYALVYTQRCSSRKRYICKKPPNSTAPAATTSQQRTTTATDMPTTTSQQAETTVATTVITTQQTNTTASTATTTTQQHQQVDASASTAPIASQQSTKPATNTPTTSQQANRMTPTTATVAQQLLLATGGGMGTRAIVGIVIGVLAAMALGATLQYFLMIRKKSCGKEAETPDENPADEQYVDVLSPRHRRESHVYAVPMDIDHTPPGPSSHDQNHLTITGREAETPDAALCLDVSEGASGQTGSGSDDYDVPMETFHPPPQPPEPRSHYKNHMIIPEAETPDDGQDLDLGPPREGPGRPESGCDDYDVPMETVHTPAQPPEPSGHYQELRPAVYQSLLRH